MEYALPSTKLLRWSERKNTELLQRYGIGFADVVSAIENGAFLDFRRHPNADRYGHQLQIVVDMNGYAFVVPCVTDGEGLFLKTQYPSRKATAKYLRRDQH